MKLCECGCGEPAPIAPYTNRRYGWVKGEPKRYVHGHHWRGKTRGPMTDEHRANLGASRKGKTANDLHPGWKGDEAGYDAIHRWLMRHKPRTGVCEFCATAMPRTRRSTGTHFANISGAYLRNPADYYELCPKCHKAFDRGRQSQSRLRSRPLVRDEIHTGCGKPGCSDG